MISLTGILERAVDVGASDIHIAPLAPICYRVSGDIAPDGEAIMRPEDTASIVKQGLTDTEIAQLAKNKSFDKAIALPSRKCRFRVNVYIAKGAFGLVMRQIPEEIIPLEKLQFNPLVVKQLDRPRGLILVTGPTGSGKSTTLASIINYIGNRNKHNIITLEDPIEFIHQHGSSLMIQREIGEDCPSFLDGLRDCLREDPDVILVGELRDKETIEAALTAAETGHLVMGTLHTTGAAKTVDRIIDVFPGDSRDQIRAQLASGLVAIISQTLCKKVGGGRIAACEVLVNTKSIAQQIREGQTHKINNDLITGKKLGMITLDKRLEELVREGQITETEALKKAAEPFNLAQNLGVDYYEA